MEKVSTFSRNERGMTDSEYFQRTLTELDEVDSQGCESASPAETFDGVLLGTKMLFCVYRWSMASDVDGVGYRTMCRLIQCFGTASRVLRATLWQTSHVERVGPKIASAIRDSAIRVSASGVYSTEV